MSPSKPTACAILLLCSAGCSHGSGGAPPTIEVSLTVERELPPYPLQPVRFTTERLGQPLNCPLTLEGPDGRRADMPVQHVLEFVPPQVPGRWVAKAVLPICGVDFNPSAPPANMSGLVPFAVVDHTILLASDRGIPGVEVAHLQLLDAGAMPAGTLRVLDDAFRRVAELPFADGDLKLSPEVFPVQGSLYYLQAVSAGEATCRLQPVWVPVPDVDPAIDFGRGGFVLTGGEPKEIRFGDEGYTGTVSLGLAGQNADTSVAIGGARSVTIVPPIRGDEDLVYELRVQIETPAGSHNDIRAVVAVRAVR